MCIHNNHIYKLQESYSTIKIIHLINTNSKDLDNKIYTIKDMPNKIMEIIYFNIKDMPIKDI